LQKQGTKRGYRNSSEREANLNIGENGNDMVKIFSRDNLSSATSQQEPRGKVKTSAIPFPSEIQNKFEKK
jgi:hypothetical protein